MTEVREQSNQAVQQEEPQRWSFLTLDHPDIEEFINWKVVEEEKVAALVAGSKILNSHLNKILTACHKRHILKMTVLTEKTNKQLALAIKDARKVYIPENYIERIIQLVKTWVSRKFSFRPMIRTGIQMHTQLYRVRIQTTVYEQRMIL